ncbi:DNA polymerase IV [Sphingomonas sp.]|uniref:DNA polymerase IV n=1 Tax=Sphingomonas sp. TaxID=28214 RepID=UPI003B0026B4
MPADGHRRIIHVDMDAFFASVEQRDDPALRGKPVAVGGSSGRGVVAAASYEARRFGVRSAMPSVTARRLCPDLIFVKSRFEAYREVSRQIRAIFGRYTDLIEPLSLDEAYLDVTADAAGLGSATNTAKAIRADILAETRLTASAGVSYNKFLAKLASDQNKPDGLCVITPGKAEAFVASLPIARFHGVGPRTAEKMARLGIATGGDLATKPAEWLREHFGSWGDYLYGAARGLDERPVRSHRIRKSVGAERTFTDDLSAPSDLLAALDPIADAAWERIARAQARGRTVTLKVKYNDFRIVTRARSFADPIADRAALASAAAGLLAALCPMERPVRLLGLTLSALDGARPARPVAEDRQLALFDAAPAPICGT